MKQIIEGYLCTHPNNPDRLIKNIKNALKYKGTYIDGVVEIIPLVRLNTTSCECEDSKCS